MKFVTNAALIVWIEKIVQISDKVIHRLTLYRRHLLSINSEEGERIFSHELARLTKGSAAQVRRDIMAVGVSGSSNKGYPVQELASAIGDFLDAPEGQAAALVGIGNLGRAILAYFSGKRPHLRIAAAFDTNRRKTGRVIHGCRCYPMEDLSNQVAAQDITLAVLAVPAAAAQSVADQLYLAGIRGFLNFAPIRLHLPDNACVEDMDMTIALEKVAFFARTRPASSRKGTAS